MQTLLDRFRSEAVVVSDPTVVAGVTADPDDDYLVALARGNRTAIVVSGDRDLHDADLPDLEVLTPRQFLDRLEEGR